MTTQPALIEAPEKLSPRHAHLLWLFTRHVNDLPQPVQVAASTRHGRLHLTLTFEKSSEVDSWAEAMNVDTHHEPIADGVWADFAEGTIDVLGSDMLDTTIQVEVQYQTGRDWRPIHGLTCRHCDDHGCRGCDPDSSRTPRAWLR